MPSSNPDPFVRFSTQLLEALLKLRVTGVQLRIILWVLRNTDGWNRKLTYFRWHQIARKLGSDRAAVWRAGQRLLQANVLVLEDRELGIQNDYTQWRTEWLGQSVAGAKQLEFPGTEVTTGQRGALPENNSNVACGQFERGLKTTFFRQSKDSSKDKLYIRIDTASDVCRQPSEKTGFAKDQHPAGAAKPVPGKYDSVPQN